MKNYPNAAVYHQIFYQLISIYVKLKKNSKNYIKIAIESLRGVIAQVRNCYILVSEFDHCSCY